MSVAVPFRPWRTGPNPVTPVPGSGGFEPLIAVDEPLSVGIPPVAPDLVAALEVEHPTIRKGVRSGWVITRSGQSARRPRAAVRWTGLTREQRDEMLAWLDQNLRWTLLAFDLAIDGPDGEVIRVRAVAPARERVVAARAAAGGEDTGGVYELEVEVEEVWA